MAGRGWGSPSLWQPWARFMTSDQDHVPAHLGCSFDPSRGEEMYEGWRMSLMFWHKLYSEIALFIDTNKLPGSSTSRVLADVAVLLI